MTGEHVEQNKAEQRRAEDRRSAERLGALLDDLDRQDGPLPSDPDEDARIDALLGSTRRSAEDSPHS